MRKRKNKPANIFAAIVFAVVILTPMIDFDKDELSTYNEFFVHNTDPFNPDSDFDQVLDNMEIDAHSSNPNQNDSDSDGLSDGDEIKRYFTDPASNDTDNDGLTDKYELFESLTNKEQIKEWFVDNYNASCKWSSDK